MRVVDPLSRLNINERHATALIVGEVDESATATQVLLPRQYPATPQDTVHGQVAGIEARPLDGHQSRQAEVGFIRNDFAPGGHVDRVTRESAHGAFNGRSDYITTGDLARDKARSELHHAWHDGLHARLGAGLD